MMPPSTSPSGTDPDAITPAEIALALERGHLPVAPMAMPLQPLDGGIMRRARMLLPRLAGYLPLRTGN